jgi:hypothetical protein
MDITEILAWSWDGHGTLTSAAVLLAASQFVALGKSFLERRLVEIEKAWRGSAAKTSPKDSLQDLMSTLPRIVQDQDIHPANLPVVGGILNPRSGQVRHFMRSSKGVSSVQAFDASRTYIWVRTRNGKNRTLRPLPRIIRLKENAPELDYSSFHGKTGTGRPTSL